MGSPATRPAGGRGLLCTSASVAASGRAFQAVRFGARDTVHSMPFIGAGHKLPSPCDKSERPLRGASYSHKKYSPLQYPTASRKNRRLEELHAWQRAVRLAHELGTEQHLDITAEDLRARRDFMLASRPQGRANLAGTWLLDSGASRHMVSRACMSDQELQSVH